MVSPAYCLYIKDCRLVLVSTLSCTTPVTTGIPKQCGTFSLITRSRTPFCTYWGLCKVSPAYHLYNKDDRVVLVPALSCSTPVTTGIPKQCGTFNLITRSRTPFCTYWGLCKASPANRLYNKDGRVVVVRALSCPTILFGITEYY